MNVFVAGATGAIGRPLVRALVSAGHDVVGLTRSSEKRSVIESAGARAVVADALDESALTAAVVEAKPTHVVHVMTALPPGGPMRAKDLDATNEIRTAGTRNLLRASIEAGARRLVAESFFAVYGNANTAQPLIEDGPLHEASGPFEETVLALRDLENQLRAASTAGSIETIALRFGGIYGPGVPSTAAVIDQARKGQLKVPSGEPGLMPFVHMDDAIGAIVAALEHGVSGTAINVADDEAMAGERFLSLVAEAAGASPPSHVPRFLVRLGAPLIAELLSWRVPLSNAKAKKELGWLPTYPSVRDGLRTLRDM